MCAKAVDFETKIQKSFKRLNLVTGLLATANLFQERIKVLTLVLKEI